MADRHLMDSQARYAVQDGPRLSIPHPQVMSQCIVPLWLKICVAIATLFSCCALLLAVYILTSFEISCATSSISPSTNTSEPTTAPSPTYQPVPIPTYVPTFPRNAVGDYKLSAQTASHAGGYGMWLLCDGSSVAKADYPELYALIGDTFGTSSNSKLFVLPNPKNKVIGIVGSNHVLGSSTGEETSSFKLTSANLPGHRHWIANTGSTVCPKNQDGEFLCRNGVNNNDNYKLNGCSTEADTFQTSSVGSGSAVSHSNMQPTDFIANVFIFGI